MWASNTVPQNGMEVYENKNWPRLFGPKRKLEQNKEKCILGNMKCSYFLYQTVKEQLHGLFDTVQEEFFLDCLGLEDWVDRLSRNVGNHLPIRLIKASSIPPKISQFLFIKIYWANFNSSVCRTQ